MGIDVGSANCRASELETCARNLRTAKTTIQMYLNSVESNWDATEVIYYRRAIEKVSSRLNAASIELNSIACSVREMANQIRQEEIEAEERARREAEERAREEKERQEN